MAAADRPKGKGVSWRSNGILCAQLGMPVNRNNEDSEGDPEHY